jgi:tetratricopeptide (TPR) repeat protein
MTASRSTPPFPFGRLPGAIAALAVLSGLVLVPAPAAAPPSEGAQAEWLTSRPRAAAPTVRPLAIGDEVRTTARQRRRAVLPDGTILYVNENSTVRVSGERRLALAAGEVAVEAAGPIHVKAPEAEVSGQGTRFAVRTATAGVGVVVARGRVAVSGLDRPLRAGQQLTPGADKPIPAPRLSQLLDWTRDLMSAAESPLVPGSSYAGGALVAIDPDGQEAKLSLRRYHVDVHVEDGFARTTIDLTYFNHADARLEGTFYFPLPGDASLSRLAMYVDGTLMEGGIAERDYARNVYESIVYRQKDPALLEWVDGTTFKMRVFPLEPRQEKRIILSYTQRLPSLYGQAAYRFPAGNHMTTVGDWSFHARVKNGAALAWASPSHELRAARDGADLVLDAAEKNARADRDVVLTLGAADDVAEQARFCSAELDGAKYLMLRYRPNLPDQGMRQWRDWVFLVESSGDRDPLLARAQIEIVRGLLGQAEAEDTFVVLAANTRVAACFQEPRPVTADNVPEALTFLEGRHLIGALDLGQALTEAGRFLRAGKEPYLVHVGSGIAALGERREDVLARRLPDNARYVGIGVGKRWARNFMKAAAERSGGTFAQINPDEPVSWRTFELAATLNTPRLLGLRVTDPDGRASFLTDVSSIAQGEELAAVARLAPGANALPERVTITGTLDGQRFERTIPVRDVAGGADYLPRTWAKLEIDRLLAEDAAKHREEIVALSKAMVVLTPFTSLLVLENEDMYEQYKVDRGRKDHWALYPCPAKIPVVSEAKPGAGKTRKPSAQEVVATTLIRVPPRFLRWPGESDDATAKPLPAGGVAGVAFGLPRAQTGIQAFGRLFRPAGFVGDFAPPGLRTSDLDLPVHTSSFGPAVPPFGGFPAFLREVDFEHYRTPVLPPRLEAEASNGSVRPISDRLFVDGAYVMYRQTSPPDHQPIAVRGFYDPQWSRTVRRVMDATLVQTKGIPPSPDPLTVEGRELQEQLKRFYPANQVFQAGRVPLADRIEQRRLQAAVLQKLNDAEDPGDAAPQTARTERDLGGDLDRFVEDLLDSSRDSRSLSYRRPGYSGNDRLFTDLLAYAPGLNTSGADVCAALETEAAAPAQTAGHIDPGVRALIDRVRAVGWQEWLVAGPEGGKAGVRVLFDGGGRHAYERTLPVGLQERVVCDGNTLLHLYSDLGIGARRTVSRFHRDDFTALVPWVVTPAEDLARGADLRLIGERTVAVIPHGVEGKEPSPTLVGPIRPVSYVRLHLVFDADGRLAERDLVEMPAGKALFREIYTEEGSVRLLDADGKEVSVQKGVLRPAAAPDLAPDIKQYVVLPLPFRSPEHVRKALKIENKRLEDLRFDDALALLAAHVGAGDGGQAVEVFRKSLHARNQRQLGFYVLLAAAGVNLDAEHADVLAEHLDEPLAQYLALHTSPVLRRHASQWAVGTGQWRDGFLQRLALSHALYQRWQNAHPGRDAAQRQAERDRAFDYVRRNAGTVFGWALLGLMEDRAGDDRDFHRALAAACERFAEVPGLEYAAHYEQARCLWKGGLHAEARRHFRELYERTLRQDVLPPIDADFRAALLPDGTAADDWSSLLRQSAARLIEQKQRPAVLVLARQCWELGDESLANHLLATALERIPDGRERLPMTLAGIAFLWETNQLAQADQLLQGLLADERLARQPSLWRLAARLAGRRALPDRQLACLERALDVEYRKLPEVINLEAFRRDYGSLLDQYQRLAEAMKTLHVPPPADFVTKVVRTADRWRALDPDSERPCQSAGHILETLGAKDLVWDYLTTPVGMRPNEAGPWANLARELTRQGDRDLADRAFAAAFDAEPTDAQLLWERAQNLRQVGKQVEARSLYRQLAEGTWQPRFAWLQTQARAYLDQR